MNNEYTRRQFIRTSAVAGASAMVIPGFGLKNPNTQKKRYFNYGHIDCPAGRFKS